MKKLFNRPVPWLVSAAALAVAGILAYVTGGRPMLFALMALWGLAACACVLALSCVMGEGRGRILRRLLAGAMAAGVLAFGGLEAVVLSGCRTDLSGEGTAIVVLGANLWGEEPSPVLRCRLLAALDCWHQNESLPIVVTGGQADDEVMSEAACMAGWLMKNGVPEASILLEEQASNTLENMRFSISILQAHGIPAETLIVVSNGPHLSRVRMLAKRCGAKADCVSARTPGALSYQAYFACREGAALVKSWLFDREVPHA